MEETPLTKSKLRVAGPAGFEYATLAESRTNPGPIPPQRANRYSQPQRTYRNDEAINLGVERRATRKGT